MKIVILAVITGLLAGALLVGLAFGFYFTLIYYFASLDVITPAFIVSGVFALLALLFGFLTCCAVKRLSKRKPPRDDVLNDTIQSFIQGFLKE